MKKQKKNISAKWIPFFVAAALSVTVVGGYVVSRFVKQNSQNRGASKYIEAKDDGNSSKFDESDTSVEAIADKVSKSVVSINGVSERGSIFGLVSGSAGTGVIVSEDGYIITNKHVVGDASRFIVTLSDGTTFEDVKVVAKDPLNDIAYMKIEDASGLKPAELGDSKTLNIGQEVIAIGNALGEYQGTVTKGIISGTNRSIEATDGRSSESLSDMIQTDAAINSGNSGGPLVNARGQVIGINTAVADDAHGIGFAIPISATKGMLKSVVSGRANVSRAVLGVRYTQITPALAKENNLWSRYGAWLKSSDQKPAVERDSAVDRAGIRDGDIITKVNGHEVGKEGSLSSLISEYSVGESVELTYLRKSDGEEIDVSITLGSSK